MSATAPLSEYFDVYSVNVFGGIKIVIVESKRSSYKCVQGLVLSLPSANACIYVLNSSAITNWRSLWFLLIFYTGQTSFLSHYICQIQILVSFNSLQTLKSYKNRASTTLAVNQTLFTFCMFCVFESLLATSCTHLPKSLLAKCYDLYPWLFSFLSWIFKIHLAKMW